MMKRLDDEFIPKKKGVLYEDFMDNMLHRIQYVMNSMINDNSDEHTSENVKQLTELYFLILNNREVIKKSLKAENFKDPDNYMNIE